MLFTRRVRKPQFTVNKAVLTRYTGIGTNSSALYPTKGYLLKLEGTVRGNPLVAVGELIKPDDFGDATWDELSTIARSFPSVTFSPMDWLNSPQSLDSCPPDAAANRLMESAMFNAAAKLNDPRKRGSDIVTEERLRLPREASGFTSEKRQKRLSAEIADSSAHVLKFSLTGELSVDKARVNAVLEAAGDTQRHKYFWFEGNSYSVADAQLLIGEISDHSQVKSPTVVLCDIVDEASELEKLQALADVKAKVSKPNHRKIFLATRREVNSPDSLELLTHNASSVSVVLDAQRWPTLAQMSSACQEFKHGKALAGLIWLQGCEYQIPALDTAERQIFAHTPVIDKFIATEQGSWPTATKDSDLNLKKLVQLAERFEIYPEPATSTAAPEVTDYRHEFVPGGIQALESNSLREMWALKMGLSVRTLDKRIMIIEQDGFTGTAAYSRAIDQSVCTAGFKVAEDKGAARLQLERHNVPVAKGFTVTAGNLSEAEKLLADVEFPVVVKPGNGNKGQAITTGVESLSAFRQAFELASNSGMAESGVIVERHISGDDYRFLVLPSGVLSVCRRQAASVYGDGTSTVLELMVKGNATRHRNSHLFDRLVKLNSSLYQMLEKQKLTLDSVPDLDQYVPLAQVGNISQGGKSTEVIDECHPSVLEVARQAAKAMGITQCGVDIIIPDHRLAVDEQELAVSEVNTNPGLKANSHPYYGEPVEIFEPLVRHAAKEAGLQPGKVTENPAVQLTVTGHVRGVGFCEWILYTATQLGLKGWVRTGPGSDQVEAHLEGPIRHIAQLSELSRRGPKDAVVTDVLTQPVDTESPSDFRISV